MAVALAGVLLMGCMARRSVAAEHLERIETCDSLLAADSVTEERGISTLAVTTREREELREVRGVIQEGIAAEESRISVSLASLADLPEGAGYSGKNGRAGVSISRRGEVIDVTGSCDSIWRQCMRYEIQSMVSQLEVDSLERELHAARRELQNYSRTIEMHKEEAGEMSERRPESVWTVLKWFLTGIATGGVLTFIGIRKWKF